ncbi:MAG TPA: glycosyltransferase family 39 protein [Polyangiaceae bacterium]|nr:glycosyltransferase family 39 protein [Polyangiaceae bacterium]
MAERAQGPTSQRAVAGALYVLSWATLAFVGRSLGVAAGEGGAIAASVSAARALGGPLGVARAAFEPAVGPPTSAAPPVLSAALGLLLGGGALDGLTALRLGLASLTALAPPLVFLLARRPLGPAAAVLAALLTLFHPRWLLSAAELHGEGALAAFVMATLWAYDRFLDRPGRGPAAALGLAFGLAFVTSPAALMLPAAVVMQGAWPTTSFRRLFPDRRWKRLGQAMAAMAAGASACAALHAALARALGPATLLWASERVAAPSAPTLSAGRALALPWLSAPASTAVLALLGLATFGRLASRYPARARPLVASAAMTALLSTRPFTWPGQQALGREGVLIPLLALFAALGARSVAAALAARPGRAHRAPALRALAFALALAGPFWASLRSPATLSATFSELAGGARLAARARAMPLHDGSPIGGLAPAIDGLGRDELAAHAPSVTPEAWVWMHRLGRLRTRVRPVAPAFAEIEVQSGGEPPSGSVALVRDRQAIVSLRALGRAPD